MSKIKIKTIYVVDLSTDFYIEAMPTEDSFDFWLCRESYGRKEYVYGLPYPKDGRSEEKDIAMIEENLINLKDPDYMRVFCLSLLDDGETLVDGTFKIKSFWD